MGEGLSHWSSMALRKSQTYFFDRHTHPNSMYSNFCHVLKSIKRGGAKCEVNPESFLSNFRDSLH